MGFFDKLFKKEAESQITTERNTLYLPVKGKVIPLEEIGDGVFSEGVLGQGCGIIPAEEKVYAPANGTVSSIAASKHAIGIQTEDGAEVLIHVGMDTVDMNGDGFDVVVKEGQTLKCGQLLMKFNMSKIKAAGHPITTAFIVTNSDDLNEVTVLQTGSTDQLTAVMRVK